MQNVECRMQNFFRSAYSAIVAPATKNVSSFFILHSSFLNRRQTNSGVALIMVLGLLTVMVLLAVTFAVSMRTERLAAGNYADTVRARELVQIGLARAMNDLAHNLGPTGLYQPGGKAYPSWNVTNSYYTNDVNGNARWNYTNAVIQKSATNYVPHILWTEATNVDRSTDLNPSNHWLPVESVTPPAPGLPNETNLMGRVAYIILNCSGLLDANYAGGAAGLGGGGTTRAGASNPNDIAIANLDEISDKESAFLIARSTNIRYETVAQLNTMGAFYAPATNLFVYSRALPGYWNTNPPIGVGTQVNLSGSVADLMVSERVAAITNAFTNIGFSAIEAGVLFSNMIDYVDEDSSPSSLEYCVESVPMINEIAISNRIEQITGGASPTYQSYADVDIEWWYPFVTSNSGTYQLQCTAANIVPVGPAGLLPSLSPPWSQPFTLAVNGMGVIHMPLNSPAAPSSDNSITFKATLSFDILRNGQTVDRVSSLEIISVSAPVGQVSWTNRECIDPRFNLNLNQWTNATGASVHSLGYTNAVTINWWNANPDYDVSPDMFASNINIRSVADMGYLVYAPWKTIKLYGTARNRVLDVFGLSTNASDIYITNTVYYGRVNCNTNLASNVTAVVFADMPVDKYPGEPSVHPLTMEQAHSVATNIFRGGICTNLSDIGRSLTNFPAGSTELEKESYFRNSMNLISIRQNMFTIIIEAQAASGGNIPKNPARQRAVAIVWRDPYTGEMFVRHIKWLGD